MIRLAWLIGGALLFGLLSGHFSIVTVVVGCALAWGILHARNGWRRGFFRPRFFLSLLEFTWDFVVDLAKSNLILAWDVLDPVDLHRVTLVEVPIHDLKENEIALLSHRITLTPGTLTCVISADRRMLLVHAMYPSEVDSSAALRRPIDILKRHIHE